MPLEENIFLMCQTCAKHRVEAGQMMMDLSTQEQSDHVPKDDTVLDQVALDKAYTLLQDSSWLLTIGKLLTGPGAEGVSPETQILYGLALDIKAKRFRYRRNGWEIV